METLTVDTFLSILIPLSLYFTITLFGAFLKDMLNTIRKKDTTFRLNRILIGSVFGAFFMVGFEGYLSQRFSLEQIVFIAFIVGSISFDIFDRVSKLDNLIKYWNIYQEMKSSALDIDKIDSVEKSDNKNEGT